MMSLARKAAPLAGSVILWSIVLYWRKWVNARVPEQYMVCFLDELFHIGQAQTYCAGNYYQWDPKITTPPGLYFVSLAWMRIMQLPCDVTGLRSTNAPFLCMVTYFCAYMLLQLFHGSGGNASSKLLAVHQNVHTAINICLFPPLFFFSALYYTDVASTAFVLLHLLFCEQSLWLRSGSSLVSRIGASAIIVILGAISLLFRQTNIFWVAIFPAGLALIDAFPAGLEIRSRSLSSALQDAFAHGIIHDPDLGSASMKDIFTSLLSIASAFFGLFYSAVASQHRSLRDQRLRPFNTSTQQQLSKLLDLVPYFLILLGFAGFVLWNGGVVLGDKSNHIATIHIPQMLYIWLYIAFFSWPIIYTAAVSTLLPPTIRPAFTKRYGTRFASFNLTNVATILVLLCVATAAVHLNTIVHPFSLADNRHYVFYFFRLLTRHRATKYFAVPVYLACSFFSVATMDHGAPAQSGPRQSIPPHGGTKTKLSYVLIWTVTCTLCVVTAPLVEPRYFILPWIMWRLRVPGPYASPPQSSGSGKKQPDKSVRFALLVGNDHRLWLETLWHLTVIWLVCYLFIFRGFTWPQEPGEVQRFMW